MKIGFVTYNLAFIPMWIEKLQPYMNDYDIVVFHIAKLQKSKPKIIEGVTYVDFTDYSGKRIESEIRKSEIEKCIILNFRSLYEQVLLRICHKLHIETIYLEHGLVSMNTASFKTERIKASVGDACKRQLNFLLKYFSFIFHSNSIAEETKILFRTYIKSDFKVSPFDKYFVFSKRSVDKLKDVFDFSDNRNIYIVGYPIFKNNDQKNQSELGVKSGGGVLYVHQPFIQDKYTSITYEEEKEYLIKLNNYLKAQYGNLIVLLHPRELLSNYQKRFEGTDISFIQSPNNYLSFADKDLIIGHYSTALLYALYFNKKTVIINYPFAKNDDIFMECFDYLSDLESLTHYQFKTANTTKEYFVGPNNTYEDIARKIVEC